MSAVIARGSEIVRGSAVRPVVLASGVGVIGTQVTALALPTLAITSLGASAMAASILFALEFGAQALAAPLLGVLVDRTSSPRRALMLASLGYGCAVLAVPVGYLVDALSLNLLAMVAGVTGILSGLMAIGVQAMIPALAPADRLVDANASVAAARSAGQVGGPALAGWLVQAWGAALALLATAAGCLVSALAFAALRQCDREPGPMARPGIIQSLRDGASALRGRPVLIRIAVTAAALNFGGSALGALYLVFAYRELGLSAALVAAAYVVNSLASILAAATAAAVIRRLGLARVVPVFAPIAAAALFAIPAAAVLPPFITLAFYEAVFGYCATVWFIATATLQQTSVPAHLLGRVVALSRTLGALALPAGALLGGALAQWWGLLPTLLTFALAGLLGTGAGLSRKPLDGPASDHPPAGG